MLWKADSISWTKLSGDFDKSREHKQFEIESRSSLLEDRVFGDCEMLRCRGRKSLAWRGRWSDEWKSKTLTIGGCEGELEAKT